MAEPQLDQASLRAEFHEACNKTIELIPLKILLQLVEEGKLDNIKLFSFLWSFIQNDSEMKKAYEQQVDPSMDKAAKLFVSENPLEEGHLRLFSNLFHDAEDKVENILHPQGSKISSAKPKENFFKKLARYVKEFKGEFILEHKALKSTKDTSIHAAGELQAEKGKETVPGTTAHKYNKTGRINSTYKPPLTPSAPASKFASKFLEHASGFPEVLEGDGKPMMHYPGLEFHNWGLTVGNTPSDTFAARTKVGVCNLVKWAKKSRKSVRCAGFRHSWSDIFSDNSQILLMLLPLNISTDLHTFYFGGDPDSDLHGVQVVDEAQNLVKVGAGTTNDQFRLWCLDQKRFCLPLNVIMVEITFGGSNAPICHGAGLGTKTLSDIVAGVEYVDANGEIQNVTDPAELRAAAGCFGLMGVVLSLTLRLDKMQVALMQPSKVPLALAIPPPPGYEVPKALKKEIGKYSQKELDAALATFKETVENDYYLEWFWFPYADKVWKNTWKKADFVTTEVIDPYPSFFQAALQWIEGFMGQIITNWWAFQALPARLQAWLLGTITMFQMPAVSGSGPEGTIKTYVSEALHFRRGIQNMRVRDTEWEIPFPAVKANGQTRDYTVVQRAWWDAISVFYSSAEPAMRLTLELRITGTSNVIMAPQRYNDLGTVSIEVLTPMSTDADDWKKFVQQIADVWTSYRSNEGESDGKGELLKVRPHWAKEWQGTKVRGMEVVEYLKNVAYKDERKEFAETLKALVVKRGGEDVWNETRERFKNPLLDEIFFSN